MPPHYGNAPNVSQPNCTPDFSRVMAQSEPTPSYASPTPVPRVHRPNCLEPMCNVQTVGFEGPLNSHAYYPPPVKPTPALTSTHPVP